MNGREPEEIQLPDNIQSVDPRSRTVEGSRFALAKGDFARLPKLVERYSGNGPRYTSYPTAVEFRSDFDSEAWLEALREDFRSPAQGVDSASLYFHLPYCRSLCYFCACNKIITQDATLLEGYLDSLIDELALYRDAIGDAPVLEQIHWGGGSPNYLTPAQMERLHLATQAHFPEQSEDADISVELDPRTTTPEQVRMLRQIGFNRVSFGVQDFNPKVQKAINRIQPFSDTAALCDLVRQEGFTGLNVDLIYGLSFQTVQTFSETVQQVLELRPDRVALYGYAHVTWLQKVQKTLERGDLPAPEERIQIFLTALERFMDAGYRYIGLDHFALPGDSLSQSLEAGKLNRNFMGYTSHRGARILAFGASSISTLPGAFAQNIKDVSRYRTSVAEGIIPVERGLLRSADDMIRGEVIERIMCEGVLDFNAINVAFQINFQEYFRAELDELSTFIEDGLIELRDSMLVVQPIGRIFSRNVAMVFDGYLATHRATQKRVFSAAV